MNPWLDALRADPTPLFLALAALIMLAVIWSLVAAVLRRLAAVRLEARIDAANRQTETMLSELKGRVAAMGELNQARQAELSSLLDRRLDHVSERLGQGLSETSMKLGSSLARGRGAHGREPDETLRAPRPHRSGRPEPRRSLEGGRLAATGPVGQADARRLRADAHGGDPGGRPAARRFRAAGDAFEWAAARCAHPPAIRSGAARRRCQVPARGLRGAPRGHRRRKRARRRWPDSAIPSASMSTTSRPSI